MDVLFLGIPQSQLEYEFQEFHADATDEDLCDGCGEYLDQCTCELWDCVDCRKLEKDCRCNAAEEAA
jgi:hypothetical protein